MDIQIQYITNPEILARVSLIYLEQKPIMRFSLIIFNIISFFFILVVILKLVMLGFVNFSEAALAGFCIAWLSGRKYITENVLRKRMKKQGTYDKQLTIKINRNGISWGGANLKDGHLPCTNLRPILSTDNGYILSAGISKFLWLPHSGFLKHDMIEEFEQACATFEVKLKKIRWSC